MKRWSPEKVLLINVALLIIPADALLVTDLLIGLSGALETAMRVLLVSGVSVASLPLGLVVAASIYDRIRGDGEG